MTTRNYSLNKTVMARRKGYVASRRVVHIDKSIRDEIKTKRAVAYGNVT